MNHVFHSASFRQSIRSSVRSELEGYQLNRLNELLEYVVPKNRFYREKFGCDSLRVNSLDEFSTLPTTTKDEWLSSDLHGIAKHHTFTREEYRRYHRTSGTRGKPMVIMDTQSDWDWWVSTWQYVLDGCGITPRDRILMAFSFGPFIGFWSAHDACLNRGCLVIPSGGMSTAARIDMIASAEPTVIFSTPTYAIHLAEEAVRRGVTLSESSIRIVFVAGEPGGSIPEVRQRIETLYGARVMDHAGATEVGPWGFGASDGRGLHVIESEFIAEYLPVRYPESDERGGALQASNSPLRELVLTSLGRIGAPVIRYRTGDLVNAIVPNEIGPETSTTFARLDGGVVGRADDMIIVRGVNIFPTSIESIVRSFPDVSEYRLTVRRDGALDQLSLEVEDALHQPDRIAERFLVQLNVRVDVTDVPNGSLPRFEAKSRRIVDQRAR